MIASTFCNETGILVSKFEGEIGLTDILKYIISFRERKEYPKMLKVILDTTEAFFTISIDQLETIVYEHKAISKNFELTLIAVIIESPLNTAMSILYQDLIACEAIKFNVFSTYAYSSMWLNKF